jgi:hypothetical protein
VRRRRALVVAALLSTALCACGTGTIGFDAAGLGLPETTAPTPLATATVATSPDGGIYKNPDHLEVVMIERHSIALIARQVGAAASSWSQLSGFGDFTLVAMRLRDDGKVSSDPQLNDLQMASDYAPPGTTTGPLRHFYHPTFPLAVVADSNPGSDCSIHLDPGNSGVAILVYPPVNLPSTVVWGRLGDFVLSVPVGGALPPLAGGLHAAVCTPPSAPPA